MLAVHGGSGANLRAFHKGDSLAFVLNVGVGGHFFLANVQSLKHDDCFPGQRRSVKGEQHIDGPAGLSRGERGLRSHLLVVHQQRFPGFLVHEHTNQSVLLAYVQAGILHGVGDGDLPGGLGGFLVINGGSGADLRLSKGHRLALVVDVSMGGDNVLTLIQIFKNHYRFPCQSGAVEGVGQLHRPSRAGGSELQLGSNLLLVHQQRFARRFVHQYTRDFIGFAHLEIFISHSVHNSDFFGRFSCVLSVHRGRSADFRDALELVIDGAQVDGGVVPGDGDVGHLYHLVPLIAFTGKLL